MENNVNITPKLKHTPLNMTGLHLHYASTRSQGCTMQPNPITASFVHALKQSLPLSLMYIYTYVLTLPHPCLPFSHTHFGPHSSTHPGKPSHISLTKLIPPPQLSSPVNTCMVACHKSQVSCWTCRMHTGTQTLLSEPHCTWMYHLL